MKVLIFICIILVHICSGQIVSLFNAPIIVKARALTSCCSPDASFDTQSILSTSFKVDRIYKGRIDSLPISREIYVGTVVPKGIENHMNIIAGQEYIVALEDSIVYNPVYKDISSAKNDNSGFFGGNYVFSHNQLVFNFYGYDNAALPFEEKFFTYKGRGNQVIKIDSIYSPNDILEVSFDALKIKDKIEVILGDGKILNNESYNYASGTLNFTLINAQKDLSFKIMTKRKRSKWKLTYKIIKTISKQL